MASRMIGIEIGPGGLQLAQVQNGAVTATASARIPQGLMAEGRVTDAAAMGALIRDTMAARNIRGRACALALPPQLVTAQHLTLPVMSRAELKLNLPFEFRDILSGELSAYDFDYIVLSVDDREMRLYAAAALRSAVEEYRSILKLAGLTLQLAVPAEMAWVDFLRSRQGLPRKISILSRSARRLYLYADGEFITGKELPFPEPDAAIRRAVNLYNFSLPVGEAPLQDLIFCGDGPPPDLPGITIHPVSRLLDNVPPQCALAAAAALHRAVPAPKAKLTTDKNVMNLVRVQKEFDHRKMLPLVALLTGAILAFAYFGILLPLNQKTQAYNALSVRQEQLAQANTRLLEFDAVQQDYLRHSDALMTDLEVNLVSRNEILTLVRDSIVPNAVVQDMTVNGNILTMNLSGITLEDVGALVMKLESCDLVQQAGILSATADDGTQARILISVTLANSGEGGEQND